MREVKERAALLLTENDYMKRIKGGKLATNIVTQLRRKKVNLPQKIQIYSAHDSTLVNLLNALGFISQTGAEPGYGAVLAFELYDSPKGCDDWIVKVSDFRGLCEADGDRLFILSFPSYSQIVYFRHSAKTEPIKISIPYCKFPCKVETLRKQLDNIWLTEKDYSKVCRKRHWAQTICAISTINSTLDNMITTLHRRIQEKRTHWLIKRITNGTLEPISKHKIYTYTGYHHNLLRTSTSSEQLSCACSETCVLDNMIFTRSSLFPNR